MMTQRVESNTRGTVGGVTLRYQGAVSELSCRDLDTLLNRSTSTNEAIRQRTAEIIARVRDAGDNALYTLARELDGVELEALEVPRAKWAAAFASLAPE